MAITFFELLSDVLSQNIQHFCKSENISLEEAYYRIMLEIQNNHSEWFSNRIPSLNYHLPECRLAYLYVVAAANANIFKYILEIRRNLQKYLITLAQEKGVIKVCALGGGPGTELLALAKFFTEAELGYPVTVDFLLLDKVQEWANSWLAIKDEIRKVFTNQNGAKPVNWPMIPSGSFVPCDVTDVTSTSFMGNIWEQDIYVLNFILSEIFNDNKGLRQFIANICEFAPSDSRFVFIERNGPMWKRRMQNIADDAGISLSPFYDSERYLDADEKPDLLGDIYEKINPYVSPRKSWNIVYCIGVKK